MEVPSTTAGVLAEIRVPAGEVAPVGAVVAVISDGRQRARRPAGAGRAAAAALRRKRMAATGSRQELAAESLRGKPASGSARSVLRSAHARAQLRTGAAARRHAVTPLARRLAARGRHRSRRLIAVRGRMAASSRATSRRRCAPAAPGAPRRQVAVGADQIKALYRDVPFEEVPLDGMRTTIAARLVQAKQTIPHFYLTADVEIGRLLALREEANAAAPKDQDGKPAFRLSVNDFIIKAWAAALQRVPAANAVWARGPHPALRAFRYRRRGRDRRRADHAGHPPGRAENAVGDLERDEGYWPRARARKLKPQRISGRLVGDLQSRHVWRARVFRHHQSAAGDHPGDRRRAPAGGRERRRRRRLRERDER